MILYSHPFSSYCQKAIIALYENDTPHEARLLADAESMAALQAIWPRRQFPVLEDEGRVIPEATSIIEHLAVHHPGPVALIPSDPAAAVEVRMMDRIFDNHVSNAQQRIIYNAIRPEAERDTRIDSEARTALDQIYPWLDARMAGREWATDYGFSLADCAAAPALFYADWTHAIPDDLIHLKAYRARLLARPSMARAVDEARPYRDYFPLGAPDRD
ncbi:glutathione S-transferase family protein [Brevundimonas sp.]|jgi:glutathione S-transferase|uniref:glutathione S-transferase family protein n=1 Tax=Brevundimonas sp. TaxID=1871086 RepID=UPI003784BD35